MTPAPFVIRMLVLDGDPDGIRMLDRSNWTGKAIVFPRPLIQKVRSLPEYKKPGVYLLCGAPGEDGSTTLYVGEGDPVRDRIDQHHAKKDFWTWGVFFTSSDAALNKVHIQYLEAELVRLAQEAKRVALDNGNTPQKPSLSAADEVEAAGFLSNMLGILPLVGVHAFEKAPAPTKKEVVLSLTSKGITGKGYESSAGFVVCKGSTASKTVAASMGSSWHKRRNALLASGILIDKGDRLEFAEDYTFTSPSAAAEALRATPTNGWEIWKNKDGLTLRQMAQEPEPKEGKAP